MRVVYSRMDEQEAVDRMRDVVRSNPRGARATLRYVARIRNHYHGYETDRAYRVLDAAIRGIGPEAVRPDDAELFERERSLGWRPLEKAFGQLVAEVPELAHVVEIVESDPPTHDWMMRVDHLIGPASSQGDPLLRSPLASKVVATYLRALRDGSRKPDLGRPVFWYPTDS
jgi:hypothetical protein